MKPHQDLDYQQDPLPLLIADLNYLFRNDKKQWLVNKALLVNRSFTDIERFFITRTKEILTTSGWSEEELKNWYHVPTSSTLDKWIVQLMENVSDVKKAELLKTLLERAGDDMVQKHPLMFTCSRTRRALADLRMRSRLYWFSRRSPISRAATGQSQTEPLGSI